MTLKMIFAVLDEWSDRSYTLF